MAAAHGRRISSLSVTYQEEYHRPHSGRKHTAVNKHHPFAKLSSNRIPKLNQGSFLHGKLLPKVPSLFVPSRTQSTGSATATSLAVPVPQLPEDQPLEDVCEDFGEEELNDVRDNKLQLPIKSSAVLMPTPPVNYFHPLTSSGITTSVLTPTLCYTPSSTASPNHLAPQSQDRHLPFVHNHNTQLYTPHSAATIMPSPTVDHNGPHHYTSPSILPYNRQSVGNTTPTHNVPALPSSSFSAPLTSILYGLEDKLRHKINVEIENFRLSVQQTLNDQFHQHTTQQPNQHPVSNEQQLESHHLGEGDSQHERYDDKVDFVQPSEEQGELDPLDSHDHEGSSTCSSVYNDSEPSNVSITGDSGVELSTEKEHSDSATHAHMEEQIDACLIELQTYSLAMTGILSKRAEYSVL